MIRLIRSVLSIVDSRTRRGVLLAVPASAGIAFCEIFGFALVFPFLRLLADRGTLAGDGIVARLYRTSGIEDPETFLVGLGCVIFAALLLKALLGIAYLRWQTGLLSRGEAATASVLFRRYLEADYTFHLRRHSAELARNVQLAVTHMFGKLLLPIVQILAECFVVVAIVVTLLVVDPLSALATGAILGIAGFVYLRTYGRRSRHLGSEELALMGVTQRQVQEGLAGVKILHVVDGLGQRAEQYQQDRMRIGQIRHRELFASQLPRYLLEAALVVSLGAIVAVVLVSRSGPDAVASLGLLAAGAFRLMPSLQRMLSGANSVQTGRAGAEMIVREFALTDDRRPLAEPPSTPPSELRFDRELRLENVSFVYPETDVKVLDGVDIALKRGEAVGLVGASGAGKTTLVDIILGLLEATEGRLVLDGRPLSRAEVAGWRRRIGYVPQENFIFDDSLRRNVALAVGEANIDEERLARAIHKAQLDDVVADLPLGLDTPLGDRGVRLSGGQRQRVGIARALYHEPDFLILDEATSSLDGVTETAITSTIESLHGEMTMLIVAHRLSTVRRCDSLLLLSAGRVEGWGSFDDLVAESETFASMVQAASLLR